MNYQAPAVTQGSPVQQAPVVNNQNYGTGSYNPNYMKSAFGNMNIGYDPFPMSFPENPNQFKSKGGDWWGNQ